MTVSEQGTRAGVEADINASARKGGVLFHCAAGHDRTGLVAAYLRITVDHWPVDKAIKGIASIGSCSASRRGKRVCVEVNSILPAQASIWGIVTSRRHFPSWMTSGILSPAGTPVTLNEPSTPEGKIANGGPCTLQSQPVVTPSVNFERP